MDRGFVSGVKKDFAKALKAAREADGRFPSAAKFATFLGVEKAAYAHWEAGRHLPDIPTMARICQLLSLEPNKLLPRTVSKKNQESQEPSTKQSAA